MTTAQALAQELAVSDRTVRRAVDRGLIRGQRPSPNKLEISDTERRYATEHWPLLQSLVTALRTEPSVETAILYGSIARGDDRSDSDVDLVVQLRAGAKPRPRDIGMRLGKALNREVEVVTLGDASDEPRFMLQLVDEGRPLVDRAERWRALRGRRHALLQEAGQRREERNRRSRCLGGTRRMSGPQGPNTAEQLGRLEQKIQFHAETLLVRHVPDLGYAKSTPEERDPAKSEDRSQHACGLRRASTEPEPSPRARVRQ